MNNLFQKIILSIFLLSFLSITLKAQDKTRKGYNFRDSIKLAATEVKSQDNTGTCWSYATVSFIESELLRLNKGSYDLSEMYFVRMAYPLKAERFVRNHGHANFSSGGQAHDIMNLIAKYGMVPQAAYTGLLFGDKFYDHDEISAILIAFLKAVTSEKNEKISPAWIPAFKGILDAYLGEQPSDFSHNGKTYTPISFAKELSINTSDYIEFSSYNHHPFYQKFNLEIPDNWDDGLYYNLPIDELIEIIDYALSKGYTIAWDGDVSEKSFNHKKGIAIVPQKDWFDKSATEKEQFLIVPEKEKVITQELRQETFNNYTTADDHLMHLVGMAFDENGTKYYIIKNSWGKESNEFGGFLYMSEAYARLKTIAIMVHKNSVPSTITKKFQ